MLMREPGVWQLAARCQGQRRQCQQQSNSGGPSSRWGRDGPCTCSSCRRDRGRQPSFPCALETDLPFFCSEAHTHGLVLHGMALHGNSMDQVSQIIQNSHELVPCS